MPAVASAMRDCIPEASVAPKSVPITATPMVAPICRKKEEAAVATPTREAGTAFWMASVYSGMEGPRPSPTSTIFHVTSAWVLSTDRVKPMNR